MQKLRKGRILAYQPEWPDKYAAIASQPARGTGRTGAAHRPHRLHLRARVRKRHHRRAGGHRRLSAGAGRALRPRRLYPIAGTSPVTMSRQPGRDPRATGRSAITSQKATAAGFTSTCGGRGSANGRYALLLRDYLRAHPLAAAAYTQVKIALARHGPTDWDLYYNVKDPVCDIIMAGARTRAAAGWRTKHYG